MEAVRLSQLDPRLGRRIYDFVTAVRDRDGKWILRGPRFIIENYIQGNPGLKDIIGDFKTEVINAETPEVAFDFNGDIVCETEEKPCSTEVELRRTGILFGEDLSYEMTPSNFVVSSNNIDAYERCLHIFESDSTSVLVYGVPGVGKTHLLHAMGWYALKEKLYKVAFFTSAGLMELIRRSFTERKTEEVKNILSKVDVLLIDDFQRFDDRKFVQYLEFIFTIVDKLIMSGGRIIATSDVKSELWRSIPARLEQRLTLSGAVPMHPPDAEFAISLFTKKFESLGIPVSEDAIELVGKIPFKNVRKLNAVISFIVFKEPRIVDRDTVLHAVAEIIGDENLPTSSMSTLAGRWKRIVQSFFDAFEAEAILKGEKLRGEKGERVNLVRTAFVAIMREKKEPAKNLSEFFGVSLGGLYKWLARDRELTEQNDLKYLAIRARVKELVD